MNGERAFAGHLGSWPEVYRQPGGHFEIKAGHLGPHFIVGIIIVAVGWLLLGSGVKWVWDRNVAEGVIVGLIALLPAAFLCWVPWTSLTLTVRADGGVYRNGAYVFGSLQEAYRLVPQAHSKAETEARQNERILHGRRQAWAVKAHEAQQKREAPPTEPGPPITFYAGSSELFVIRGAGEWIQLAEFGQDPQARTAMQLASALEFVFHQIKLQQAQIPIQRKTTLPVPEHDTDEYE